MNKKYIPLLERREEWPTALISFFQKYNEKSPLTLDVTSGEAMTDVRIAPDGYYISHHENDEVHIFEDLERVGFFTDEEEFRDFADKYVPIAVVFRDDFNFSFEAVLVDVSHPDLPTCLFGYSTDGQRYEITPSLVEFEKQHLLPKKGGSKKILDATLKELSSYYQESKYSDIKSLAESFFQEYADFVATNNKKYGTTIASIYQMYGVSLIELGETEKGGGVLHQAFDINKDVARISLASYYAYQQKEYTQAQEITKGYTSNEEIWFHKVRIDAYCHVQLGNEEKASKLYEMIQERYAYVNAAYIEEAVVELESLVNESAIASSILTWFTREEELSTAKKEELRSWWEALELNLQLCLVEVLPGGRDIAREAEPFSITEEKIFKILQTKKISIGREQQLTSFLPLNTLSKLEVLKLNKQNKTLLEEELPQLVLPNIKEIDINRVKLETIDMFLHFKTLEVLTVSSPREISLAGIEQLSSLKELSIDNISDVEGVSQLTSLEVFETETDELENLDFLSEMKNLKELKIESTDIKDIQALSHLTLLEELELKNCEEIDDYSVIATCQKLKELTLMDCQLKDVSWIKNLTNLEELDLNLNVLEDVSELQYLPHLKELKIAQYDVKLDGLLALANIKTLEELELGKKSIKGGTKTIKKFQELRPEVELDLD